MHTPHAAQDQFLQCNARFIVMNCGRRFGKLVAVIQKAYAFASENPNTLTLLVLPNPKRAYQQIKEALADRIGQFDTEYEDDLYLELTNGARIVLRSLGSIDILCSEKPKSVDLLIVKEAARLPANVWYSTLYPLLKDTGCAVLISTPAGCNWFHKIYQLGLNPEFTDNASFTFPTSANPYIPADAIEDIRHVLPDRVFRQEVLAEFIK